MKEYTVEIKMIIRSVVEITADTVAEAIEKAQNGEFDQKASAIKGCPAGHIEVDNIEEN